MIIACTGLNLFNCKHPLIQRYEVTKSKSLKKNLVQLLVKSDTDMTICSLENQGVLNCQQNWEIYDKTNTERLILKGVV